MTVASFSPSPHLHSPHLRWLALARLIRARARLISALVLFTFVVNHLAGHILLLVSLPYANTMLQNVMWFWWKPAGTLVLASALAVHLLNALWAIFARRYLRLSRWEWAQLLMGLAIPPILLLHIVTTKVADEFLGTVSDYYSVLTVQWVISPSVKWLQMTAVLVVWTHACIGLHFWLRTKRWYARWRPFLASAALLIPALAVAGYVAAGNQILREAAANPGFVKTALDNAHLTAAIAARTGPIAFQTLLAYFALVALPFAGRGIRAAIYNLTRPPRLTHAGGRTMPILPGATVLETLRANGVPHASVCGGRARCTTCRIQVVQGLESLPEPAGLEARALERIGASPGMRLACQIRPVTDITITPLLAADAGAMDGLVRGGMEGSERHITVVFVDLRGSTTLGEAKMPYDVLFLLNQFFGEMTKALAATNGHYSNFTGDGLMAIYGLETVDPAACAIQALQGAREMLRRLGALNAQLNAELGQPLRIGIGIHHGEAIVGAMGPPRSRIITAIGDTVNTTARLESLTKDFDCALILSRRAAEVARLDLSGMKIHEVAVKGRNEPVAFYALDSVPDLPN